MLSSTPDSIRDFGHLFFEAFDRRNPHLSRQLGQCCGVDCSDRVVRHLDMGRGEEQAF